MPTPILITHETLAALRALKRNHDRIERNLAFANRPPDGDDYNQLQQSVNELLAATGQ